jgi:hypothetical protein
MRLDALVSLGRDRDADLSRRWAAGRWVAFLRMETGTVCLEGEGGGRARAGAGAGAGAGGGWE